MNELNRQLIAMYAKQLRIPTFNHYDEVIRQLEGNKGFDDFLVALMRTELDSRQLQKYSLLSSFVFKCTHSYEQQS